MAEIVTCDVPSKRALDSDGDYCYVIRSVRKFQFTVL